MAKLVTIFKKGTQEELNKIKIVTTGKSGIVEMTVKNTSDKVITNPKIDVPLGVKLLEPDTLPASLKPNKSFNAKIEIDGIVSFKEELKFTYEYLKIEQS